MENPNKWSASFKEVVPVLLEPMQNIFIINFLKLMKIFIARWSKMFRFLKSVRWEKVFRKILPFFKIG